MEYTKKQLSIQKTDHPRTEEICRLICKEEGILNPEKVVTGHSGIIDGDFEYTYWQYRLPMVRKIIEIIIND